MEVDRLCYFDALLGTDNLKRIVWLLNNHAVEMRRKQMSEIEKRRSIYLVSDAPRILVQIDQTSR